MGPALQAHKVHGIFSELHSSRKLWDLGVGGPQAVDMGPAADHRGRKKVGTVIRLGSRLNGELPGVAAARPDWPQGSHRCWHKRPSLHNEPRAKSSKVRCCGGKGKDSGVRHTWDPVLAPPLTSFEALGNF